MSSHISAIEFRPFNEHQPVRHYQTGYLPHLRQRGCTYFVTYRLADSIPVGRLNQWNQERNRWLDARGIDSQDPEWKKKFFALSIQEQSTYERSFASRLFESLDCGLGDCCLKNPDVREEIVESLEYFNGSRFLLGDFVIMPNHVHALITPLGDFELESILHSIKSWSSNRVNCLLKRSGPLWMKDSFDRLVRDGDELLRTQEYIRRNPIKGNLVENEYILRTREYILDFETV